MTATSILLGITNIVAGLVFILISIPLVKRKIKPNGWYGFRIPKAFESEENWYKINEYGGRLLLIWSIPIVLIGVVTLFIPIGPEDEVLATILGTVPLLLLLIPLIQTLIWARKL